MELLEADSFVLQSFDTLTGLKFFVTADPDSKKLDAVLREVYELYSDYVLKVATHQHLLSLCAHHHSSLLPRLNSSLPAPASSLPTCPSDPHMHPLCSLTLYMPSHTLCWCAQNPSYETDMPIHCEQFDEKLIKLAEDYQRR